MNKNRRQNFETALLGSTPNKFKTIFEVAPVAIVEGEWRKSFEVLNFNPAAFQLFGATDKEGFVSGFNKLLSKIPKKALFELLSARVKGLPFEAEFQLPTFSNGRVHVMMRLAYINPMPLGSYHVLLTFQDITSYKRNEVGLKKLAQLDGLTKIFNHKAIVQRLDEELTRAKRYHLHLTCIIFDLDNFKKVNDTLGHLNGDKCIKKAASMLKQGFRKTDIVGRYGGDEFLVILPETKIEQASIPIERFLKDYRPVSEFKHNGKSVKTTFSVGISGFPHEGLETPKDLIAAADKTLYISKETGGNQINIYQK